MRARRHLAAPLVAALGALAPVAPAAARDLWTGDEAGLSLRTSLEVGVVAPAATYTLSDAASVHATVQLPWGSGPEGLALRSEHGATPRALFVQIRLYD